MSFNELGLSAELLRAIGEQGYTDPTPIQRQSIPVILEGRDVMAAAQTGTGKTAGFTLPLLQRLNTGSKPPKGTIRALVLTPTRELAAQVEESVCTYGRHQPLRSVAIFGGVNINPQIKALRSGVDILVATPGRLLDHVQQKTIDLSKIEILVLDEADRMLDMGFVPEVRKILALLPKQRQNLMFSATFSPEIKKLANGILREPVLVEAGPRNTSAELVAQVVHQVDQRQKRGMLSYLISSNNWQQVLVFIRTKHSADRLARQLQDDGLKTVAIHGNKSQVARTRALADFKSGKVRVLVATDIAARGLDIDQLPHVVNYDLPNVPEDYVHRIGRTGRAGNEGCAISLVSPEEHKLLQDIERLIRREIPRETIWDFVAASWGYGDTKIPEGGADATDMPRRGRTDSRSRPGGDRRRRSAPPRSAQMRDAGGRRQQPAREAHARPDEKRPQQQTRDTRPHAHAKPAHSSRREQPQGERRQPHSPQHAHAQPRAEQPGKKTSQGSGQNKRSRRGRNSSARKEIPALLG